MAMSLIDSAALMNDTDFRARVKVAALQYATGIFQQPSNSKSRTNWAQQTMASPDMQAQVLTPNVVMNVNVQTYGAEIDDPNLLAAVQVTADMMM